MGTNRDPKTDCDDDDDDDDGDDGDGDIASSHHITWFREGIKLL